VLAKEGIAIALIFQILFLREDIAVSHVQSF